MTARTLAEVIAVTSATTVARSAATWSEYIMLLDLELSHQMSDGVSLAYPEY